MKGLLVLVILLVAFTREGCGLYELNDTVYARMPPIYHMDDYESCLKQRSNVYCTVIFGLKSEKSSELLTIITKYSEHRATRFNHTNLRYGICVTKTCSPLNESKFTKEQNSIIEDCLNELFEGKYNLKTVVTEFYCNKFEDTSRIIDKQDICVAAIVLAILAFTVTATLLDVFVYNETNTVNTLISAFSIKHNWKLLRTTGIEPEEVGSLKALHGIKVLLFYFVVLGHSYVSVMTTAKNTKIIEESYNHLPQYVLFGGSIIVQVFFVISGMLLIYKIQLNRNRMKINFYFLPKLVALRWLRLTPPIAIVLAIVSSWLRHTKSGPFWEIGIGTEISDCHQRGWLSLVYLNNYTYNSQCLPHTWSIAADMQLFCLGVILYQLAVKTKAKKTVLCIAFAVGIILPAIHTYTQDLDALILMSPERSKTFFGNDPTYNEVYKRGHTNIPSYVVGLALGYIIDHLKINNFNAEKFKKYRLIYWALLPACCGLILLGSIFFSDAPRPPMYLRLLYATFAKPLFAVMVAILILGMVFNYENIYRRLFECNMWLPLSRLSYAAFILHFVIIRMHISTGTELMNLSAMTVPLLILSNISVSFIVAIPLWLLVEAPVTGLVKFYIHKKVKSESNRKKD